MEAKPTLIATSLLCAFALHLTAAPSSDPKPAAVGPPIPWSDLGAKAGAGYKGDGLSITPTENGARLHCVFQRLEGEATAEGLWLSSTVTNTAPDRFQVKAIAVSRVPGAPPSTGLHAPSCPRGPLGTGLQTSTAASVPALLSQTGTAGLRDMLVTFARPGLTEEYSVSLDGVRQDFVVMQRPEGAGELRVELAVAGARVELAANGARLVLAQSGRKIAYSRLRATDAAGRELPARFEVVPEAEVGTGPEAAGRSSGACALTAKNKGLLSPALSSDKTEGGAADRSTGELPLAWAASSLPTNGSGKKVTPLPLPRRGRNAAGKFFDLMPVVPRVSTPLGSASARRLAVVVDDAAAVYPVRIDPTFSDGNWITLNGAISGADHEVYAAAADGSGNLYIGGWFNLVGDVDARGIAKWDGTKWSALGSGIDGGVYALAVSGSNVYAGGYFTIAGGSPAANVAKWAGGDWSALGSGLNDYVYALALSGSDVYAGGRFTGADGRLVNHIAKWSGNGWLPLGSGLDGLVYALAVSGGNVYAGGAFMAAGGAPANHIAKWDGSNWSALGSGTSDEIYALAASGGDVYAGGAFTMAGGSAANCIAKWGGTAWSALGSGLLGAVRALAVAGANLYAAGDFTMAGGHPANYLAKWDGGGWSPLGSGVDNRVYALAASGSDLYAGGDFTSAGGTPANHIAKWNGGDWSALGSGADGSVLALAASGSNVYAGGYFTSAGGVAADYVAKWDGSGWSPLSAWAWNPGMNGGGVRALAASGSELYAGGGFRDAGGVVAPYIAGWDGNIWSAFQWGMNGYVYALAVSGSDLYAAGDFSMAGGNPANHIARWDGTKWSALGVGMNSYVDALAVLGVNLYAGGAFTTAGGGAANYIARWNGSGWSALGSGMNNIVRALALSGGNLYAGGAFSTAGGGAADYIARWNGSGWSALGSGMNGYVDALAVSGSNIYAGGVFSMAGGSPANCIAKWNGSSWSALGSGMASVAYSPDVGALKVSGGDVYAGGYFTTADGVPATNIAKWDGTSWSALGSGVDNRVYALAASGSDLYAGGYFTTAGGIPANCIAKWNGSSWSGLGSGMNSYVQALAVSGNELYAGGHFASAGGKCSPYLAKATIDAPPVIISQPQDVTVDCGRSATLAVTVTSATPISYQWYWFSTPIAQATNSSYPLVGSVVTAGLYTVVATNAYGAATSSIAWVSVLGSPPATNHPPVAVATASPNNPEVGQPVHFDGSQSWDPDRCDGIAGYEWDFGDGTSATIPKPDHVFEFAGDYTVNLTVWDANGAMGFTSLVVSVAEVLPPDNLTVATPATSSLDFFWTPADPDTAGFSVNFAAGGLTNLSCEAGVDIGMATNVVYDHLLPGTEYGFLVCAYNSAHYHSVGEYFTMSTLPLPLPVTGLAALPSAGGQIAISVRAPEAGRSYQLWTSSDLRQPFQLGPVLTSSLVGQRLTFLVPTNGAQGYYRIESLP